MQDVMQISWLTARPIAHRGLHDMNNTRWENTLSAFGAAIAHGYAIECDVRLSGDDVPVVFHDDALKRLTGEEGLVGERSAAELSTLRIGGTDERIPTLATVLEHVAGAVPLIIELKGSGRDAGLAAAVAKVLSGYHGHVALMSFEHRLIRALRKHAPDVPRGLTAYGTDERALEAHFAMLAHDIAFVSYAVTDLPNRFVSFVRTRLGMPVITWTVRSAEEVERTFAFADQMTFEGFEPDLAIRHGDHS